MNRICHGDNKRSLQVRMSFSGAGDPVLTASDDNTAKLWSIEKVTDIQTLPVRTVSAHLQNGKE